MNGFLITFMKNVAPPAGMVRCTQDHSQVDDPKRDTERLEMKTAKHAKHNNVSNHIQS